MAGPYSKAKRKAEDAFEVMIQTHATGEAVDRTIVKGMSASDLTGTRIEVVAYAAEPDLVGGEDSEIGGYILGNWKVRLHIAVVVDAADLDRAVFGDLCAAVEDVMMMDDVEAELDAAGIDGFRAFAWRPGANEDSTEEHEYRSEYEGVLYCAPSLED